jgi:hypothetical protein
MTFSDVYITRQGAGITLPSGCSGFVLQAEPPVVLPATTFGQGLSFRFILTPQVWAISGDIGIGFDGRDGDPSATGVEVAHIKTTGAGTTRFSIVRPVVGATGLEYARLASVSGPVQGVNRLYQCVLGIPTLAEDLAVSASGAFPRNVVMATAYVREGSTARTYSLGHSVVSISADMLARRVAISLRLIGTPTAGGADAELGTFAASAPIDPASGNFTASLTSGDRPITGTISGRFFGPQAIEIGAAFSASDTASAPGFSFAGAVYGIR